MDDDEEHQSKEDETLEANPNFKKFVHVVSLLNDFDKSNQSTLLIIEFIT